MKELILKTEAMRCLCCEDAPCSKVCKGGLKPSQQLLHILLDDIAGAAAKLKEQQAVCDEACQGQKECMKACVRGRIDRPIDIPGIHRILKEIEVPDKKKELKVRFLGMDCENPFLLSSSCVSGNYEMCARALEEGWGGLVYKTIGVYVAKDVSPRFEVKGGYGLPFRGFRNLEEISGRPAEDNFQDLKKLSAQFPDKLIISSIMGRDMEEWKRLSEQSAKAGVKALECNVSCPHMGDPNMGAQVSQSLELVSEICRVVTETSGLPVLAKLPYASSGGTALAMAARQGGASGVTAINTIPGLLCVDPATQTPLPGIEGLSGISGCSGEGIHPLANAYICSLKKAMPDLTISGTGGVSTWKEALDFILSGAATVQVTTSVMEQGYRIIHALKDGLSRYLGEQDKEIADLTGTALLHITEPGNLCRDKKKKAVIKEEQCIGCGRCYVSCRDGGHQAITFSGSRKPQIQDDKCQGCGLCQLVCPTQAMGMSV